MKSTHKIVSYFIAAVLMFTAFATHKISAQGEELTQEKIFELIVKQENGIDAEEDVDLEQEHYDRVYKVATDYQYYINGYGEAPVTVYLTDFSYLEKLDNLTDFRIHVPTEVGAFEYDLNYLNTLPYETLTVGRGYGSDYTEAQILNQQINQLTILQGLNPVSPINVKVAKFGFLNNDFLLGLNLKPNISDLSTVDAEINIKEIYVDYEFSHEDNGVRIYKAHVENPFALYITLDDDGVVVKDELGVNTEWNFSVYGDDLEPTFYDIDGNPITHTVGYSDVYANEVASMDVYFTEERLNEMIAEHVGELRYMAQQVFEQEEQMIYYEEQLKIETDPVLIAEIEEDIISLRDYINWLENELAVIKAKGSSFALKVGDFSIQQEGVDALDEHHLYTSQRFYVELLLDDDAINTHTVTFESNGGTRVPQMREVATNSMISKPTDPTKGVKTFEGWFKEATLENEWDFATDVVTGDITLYAKWDEVIYDVHFDSHGGTPVPSKRVVENEHVERPTAPTKDGFDFDGWYITDELKVEWDFDEDVVVSSMTLHAKWEPKEAPITEHTVTFNSNGGSKVNSYLNVEHNTLISAPLNPTRAGYTFKGWFVDNNTFKTAWKFESDKVVGDLELHAKWEKKGTDEETEVPVVPPVKEPEDKTPPTGLNDATFLYVSIIVAAAIYLGLRKQTKRY